MQYSKFNIGFYFNWYEYKIIYTFSKCIFCIYKLFSFIIVISNILQQSISVSTYEDFIIWHWLHCNLSLDFFVVLQTWSIQFFFLQFVQLIGNQIVPPLFLIQKHLNYTSKMLIELIYILVVFQFVYFLYIIKLLIGVYLCSMCKLI